MNENKPRKNTSAGKKLIIAAALLLAVAAAQYIYLNWTGLTAGNSRELRMTSTQKGVSYDFDAGASFYSYDAKFYFFCTKDGIKYISSNGDIKWQETFSLSKPLIVAKGGTVAVGEAKGKHVYVFDATGLIYDVAFDHPVLYFSINEAGYLAAIMQMDKGYAVNVYSRRSGVDYIFSSLIHDSLFYPTAADVSEDGRYTVITMLDLNVRMTSRAAFYYLNAQDAWSTEEGLFAWEDYPGQLIYCAKFMADNRALIFTDTQIACYKPGDANALDEQWLIPLHNKLDQLTFYGGSRFAYATGDKLLNDDEASEPGMVNIYAVTGERTGEFSLGRKATYLSMGYDAVIVGADRSFYALNSHGVRLWEYIALQDTRQLIFLDNTDTTLIAGNARAEVLKRVKPQPSAPDNSPIEPDLKGD